jgi:hypothetical protein
MPKQTIDMLDQLHALGFSDDDFRIIHHMSDATINTHRQYCEKVDAFRAGDTNEKVRERIALIHASFVAGHFSEPAKPGVFRGLAEAAVAEIEK